MLKLKTVLSIAGSDCSGGAGIQADIKTITVHNMYAMSAITALTAQNTVGVYGVQAVPPAFVAQQLDCVFSDIFPDAVKIGMVFNAGIIDSIVDKIKHYGAKNVVVDPVMVSTSGTKLLPGDVICALITKLIPIADCITPNIHEAEVLAGMDIVSNADMLAAAEKISGMLPGAVLIKGGHLEDCADDLFFSTGEAVWIKGEKINNPNTHGTGCTLSSAIACNLAGGMPLYDSVAHAKSFVSSAIAAGLDLGKGAGPLNHLAGRGY